VQVCWEPSAAFSFFPTKNLGGAGDGGIMTTDNPEICGTLETIASSR
jgi:dTDP-4-amino-4,6-dideoxygalactose transaminase